VTKTNKNFKLYNRNGNSKSNLVINQIFQCHTIGFSTRLVTHLINESKYMCVVKYSKWLKLVRNNSETYNH